MVLLLLVILWVVVLVPPWLKNRNGRGARPLRSDGHSIANHRNQLQVLDQALWPTESKNVVPFRRGEAGESTVSALRTPQPPQRSFAGLVEVEPVLDLDTGRFDFGSPASRRHARRRRQQVLGALFAATVLTLLVALAFRGPFIVLNLLVDAAFVGYVILVVRHHQAMQERQAKVRPIRPATTVQAPARMQAAPDYLVRQSSHG